MLTLLLTLVVVLVLSPILLLQSGHLVGSIIRSRTKERRQLLLEQSLKEENYRKKPTPSASGEDDEWEKVENSPTRTAKNGAKAHDPWKGVVGFFHPFCNAGGGGERVLWAAIRATQIRYPSAFCVVYTGDHDADKAAIIRRVKDRFNIHLHPPTVSFVYLSKRHWVLSSSWPHFTLLGQSIGSLILAWEALTILVPDVFIDTMGYAFTLALSKYLFPEVPTGAYVHYPTISTDMLGSLDEGGQGVNAGTGKGLRGNVKKSYWHLFAGLYGWVGSRVDVVMTNSSWTQAHIRSLWAAKRTGSKAEISVVFPPVAVQEVTNAVEVSRESEKRRGRYLLYIAQFRPEKNHQLILSAFAKFLSSYPSKGKKDKPKLILVGSVRNDDDSKFIYKLRLLANELEIKDDVEFILNASWPDILAWLRKAWVGVNGMWNEHFGIGVVEYQAAGLISVVNDSGGPKEDIVVEIDGKPTGFHATTVDDYAAAFSKAFSLSQQEVLDMRSRARKSAARFSEEVFEDNWLEQMAKLVTLQEQRAL